LITSGSIPTFDANTLYAIHFAPDITVTQGGQTSCVEFCAYHATIQSGSAYIFYSVIPDQGGNCNGVCGNNPSLFDNLCSVSAHELIESITDGGIGLAEYIYGPPVAWYDHGIGEIGDLCVRQQATVVGGNGQTFTIQKGWSNKYNACISQEPTSPTVAPLVAPTVLPPTASKKITSTPTAAHKATTKAPTSSHKAAPTTSPHKATTKSPTTIHPTHTAPHKA